MSEAAAASTSAPTVTSGGSRAPSAPSTGGNGGALGAATATSSASAAGKVSGGGVGAAQRPAEAPVEAATETKQAPPKGETKAEADARKMRVKVNGEVREIERDAAMRELFESLPDDDVASLYALRRGGHEALDSARKMREQAEQFARLLHDPAKAMQVLERLHGADGVRQMTEAHLGRLLEDAALPAEERERRARESEWQRRERELKEREAAFRKEQAAAAQARHEQEYARDAAAAIRAEFGDKPPPRIAEMVYAHAERALSRSGKIDWSEVTRDARDELNELWDSMHSSMDAEAWEKRLGPERQRELARRYGERVKAQQAAQQPAPVPQPKRPAPAHTPTGEKLTPAQYIAQLRKREGR